MFETVKKCRNIVFLPVTYALLYHHHHYQYHIRYTTFIHDSQRHCLLKLKQSWTSFASLNKSAVDSFITIFHVSLLINEYIYCILIIYFLMISYIATELNISNWRCGIHSYALFDLSAVPCISKDFI